MSTTKSRIYEINSFREALQVRAIRNEVRHYMTHNTHYISIPRQAWWYYRIYKKENGDGKARAYIFTLDNNVIGYGLILVKDDRRWWVSGGIKAKYRGYGYGEDLFKWLTDTVLSSGQSSWLEVLSSNEVAQSLYKKLGYRTMIMLPRMLIMKRDK